MIAESTCFLKMGTQRSQSGIRKSQPVAGRLLNNCKLKTSFSNSCDPLYSVETRNVLLQICVELLKLLASLVSTCKRAPNQKYGFMNKT